MRIRNHTLFSEKPRGKRRKLRDNGENLLLRTSSEDISEAHAQKSEKKYVLGGCVDNSCSDDMACIPVNQNTSHYCLCTTNGQPPTEDFKCVRNTVPVKTGGKPIHNVIPPQPTSNSTDLNSHALIPPTIQMPQSIDPVVIQAQAAGSASTIIAGAGAGAHAGALAAAVGGGLLVCLVVVVLLVCYLRRRICLVPGKTQPRVRPGEPLLAERYITNPQYGVYGAGTLPARGTPCGNNNGSQEPHVLLLDENALTFLEEVGEGCFGKVHKGVLRTNGEEEIVAVKVLKESAGRNAEEDFVREVSIMSAFRHPNILALLGVVNRDDISATPWMVFEYMEWGDLAGVLRGSRGGGRPGPTLDEAGLLHVALQVARGMQYLASRRFVHRDLAARNCLVGSRLAVKIADFGMSRDVYTCDYYKMGGMRPMPVRWMSPESILYARFTHESDIWSYGVVLWEIYSRGKQPYYGHINDEVTKLIQQGIVLVPPEDCPGFARDLMRSCWMMEPEERIGFDEICKKLDLASDGTSVQIRLPRPPADPQDSAGYLIPVLCPPSDYLAMPDPDESASSEDDEEEYT